MGSSWVAGFPLIGLIQNRLHKMVLVEYPVARCVLLIPVFPRQRGDSCAMGRELTGRDELRYIRTSASCSTGSRRICESIGIPERSYEEQMCNWCLLSAL